MAVENVRVIQSEDIKFVLEIYKPYILESAFTFEFEIPSTSEFSQRVEAILKSYPWLVYADEEGIKGYAYAGPHRSRSAYQWSVESSVYLDRKWTQQNIGQQLYERLFEVLRAQKIANIYAGITLPNIPSVAFHKKFGFEKIGTYNRVGFKFKKWHDVVWYNLRINENQEGDPPLPFSQIASHFF